VTNQPREKWAFRSRAQPCGAGLPANQGFPQFVQYFPTAASRRESGPCLSSSVADHPLRPATRHRLGSLLHHQL